MNQAYTGLLAQCYDQLFTVSQEEYLFYRYFLDQMGPDSKSLELGCGTGQLLVPLLQDGYSVEGVDSSSTMLLLCKEKAARKKLMPVLYNQSMESLTLTSCYDTIFIPACAFMYLLEYRTVHTILSSLAQRLTSKGQLIISLGNFWHELNQTSTGTGSGFELVSRVVHDKKIVLFSRAFTYQAIEQIRQGLFSLELFDEHNRWVTKELHALSWRWYGKYEFEMILRQAGFAQITAFGDYMLEPVHDDHAVTLWVARC